MPSEMQKRIARAMGRSKAWPVVFSPGSAEVLALAAMKAMLEPTAGMTAAGGDYVMEVGGIDCMHAEDRGPPWNIKGRETGARELFRAMLSHEITAAQEGR